MYSWTAIRLPKLARPAAIAVWPGLFCLQAGCHFFQPAGSGFVATESRPIATPEHSSAAPTPLLASDSPSETTPGDAPTPIAPLRADAILTVVRIRVPTGERARVAKVWDHLREDVIDADTSLRLRRNGFRAGIGSDQAWGGIRELIEQIGPAAVDQPEPLRMPLGFPIALELDSGPRDQTLFYLGADGVLSGQTWRESRDVLRVSFAADPQRRRRLRMSVVPEVRQRLPGFRMVQTPAGMAQEPKYNCQGFETAAFTLALAPGEFVLLAPSDRADVSGMIGRVFLTEEQDGQRVDSLFFLRAEPNYGQ